MRERVEEHIADDQLAAVLLAELAVESPAQRVEFLLGLLRVEGDHAAVVLVALLAGDVDVVVQRDRVVGEAALGDVGDRLAVDALGDRQPQRLVRQDRSRRAVEREVIPARAGCPPDRDALRCVARSVSSSSVARPVASIVLFCRAGMRAASSSTEIGDAVQQRRCCPTISGCAST